MQERAKRWTSALATFGLMGSLIVTGGSPVRAESTQAQDQTVVVFQIGSPIYTVDGKEYEMDVAPRIDQKSERTLLPVRYVGESMNASVFYNQEGQRIAVVHNETQRVLDLAIGESTMKVSDSEDQSSEEKLDQAPVIDNPGRTMLPVRAVAEALYGKVSYDPRTRKITIVRPPNKPATNEPGPAVLDFGKVLPQDHEDMDEHLDNVRPVVIANKGQGPLFVDGVQLKEGAAFSLCGKKFEPFVLEPGQSHSILVCAYGREPGEHVGVLEFRSRVKVPTDLLIRPIKLIIFYLGCRVVINGGGLRPNPLTTGTVPLGPAGVDNPVVNVGQQISLQASATGIFSPYTYQWTVNGVHIKDYQELASGPWSTTAMNAGDYQNAAISYYWKQTGNYLVSVKARNAIGFTCSASTTFSVERNGVDINRQAEDFYTWNHTSRVLVEHRNWHAANMYSPCVSVGTLFYTFHNAFLGRFNQWRAEFGYPAIAVWNPGTPLPGGLANSHLGRNAFYNPAANVLKSYLTPAGGALASPCFGATKKADFPSANAFWIEVEGPFHNGVHVAIGGDMGFVSRAPKDPVFWRFHQFVNGL